MKKLIKTADLRKALDSHGRNEISFGKMVEMLNEAANKALSIADVSGSFCKCKEGTRGRTVTEDFEHQVCDRCGLVAK